MHDDFKVLVLTPAGILDPSLAIAAARAGHTGVLNLELGPDLGCEAALDKLAEMTDGGWGVCHQDAEAAARIVGSYGARGLSLVLLPAEVAFAKSELVLAMRAAGVQVLFEALEWDPRLCGALAADGIVLKGHEAGGRVGEATAFILLQQAIAAGPSGPVYVRGGVGLISVAAMRAGGAAGVVLDDQLLMLRESAMADRLSAGLKRFTGAETVLIEESAGGAQWRGIERPGSKSAQALRQALARAKGSDRAAIAAARFGWDEAAGQIAPIGQAATFAPDLAERFGNVAKVANAMLTQSAALVAEAARSPVWAEGQGVAAVHKTKWPIVQGPMTRVSDTAAFAEAVSTGGGLPMLALALMRPDAVDVLLAETAKRLKGQSWGVGLLGFAPSSLIKAQVEVSLRHGPSFALIAGGRPDQARALEADGIPSYLHVPSPRLLKMFLDQGAKRFVFEGRECGGHVGPMSSMILWDSMVRCLLDEVKTPEQAEGLCILFAGGIHDAASAAMVACFAAPLAARGIACGVLMGTAYLFTRESVESGTIVSGFQKVMLDCTKTVTLETGPGHASRAAMSGFADEFAGERVRLEGEGVSSEDQREALEGLTLGRLRLASKATERQGDALKKVPLKRQVSEGMYMTGQVAMLRSKITTVDALHREIAEGSAAKLDARAAAQDREWSSDVRPQPVDIAIVGMSALLPGSDDLKAYWENLLDGVNAITEIPAHRWDWRLYFDEDPTARDKIYSRWGGFLKDMPFDPMRYGIPPRSIPAIDPLQLMTLEVARRCLDDAGFDGTDTTKTEQRLKTSIILGASGGAGDVGAQYAVRAEMPRFMGSLDDEAASHLPEWTEDSFAGILLNVAAGRAANRLDFGGVNYTVDAACGSSLAAVYQAVLELETGRSDMVLAGGIDTVQGPFGYLCFSKTRALSPRGRCSSFQDDADGIVISEGIAMVALKRLKDAERDGDRVYAVIKGVGGSSDGKAKSMTAPHPDGQIRALGRAYDMAGYSPATVGLFEAHGTGTVAGDTSEMTTVTRLLQQAGAEPKQAAIGSVKTLIGHTKAAAGISGLIKATLAVHHGVLPPHGRRAGPNARLKEADIPLYLADKPRPWISPKGLPRRAGVSAFGFGGTNFHVTLEEHAMQRAIPALNPAARRRWKEELLLWRGPTRADLARQVAALEARLAAGFAPDLGDLAHTLGTSAPARGLAASIVVGRGEELTARLAGLSAHLSDGSKPLPPGASFSEKPMLTEGGKLALVFPGQGSQYPEMMSDIAVLMPEITASMALADETLGFALSRNILPAGVYDDAEMAVATAALTRTDIAQPALGAVEAGLWAVLASMGAKPDMAAGHSYGEFVALHAAGVMDRADLFRVSRARGQYMVEAAEGGDLGTMAAARGERAAIEALIKGIDGLCVANHNAPEQSILSGTRAAIEEAQKRGEAAGISIKPIQVGAAFHSPIVAPAEKRLAKFIAGMDLSAPRFAVYSNTTAQAYSADPAAIGRQLAAQLSRPVEFVAEIAKMYDDGARVFLTVGPKAAHANMVRQILGAAPHRSIAMDDEAGGLRGLLAAVGALLAEGAALDLSRLWAGRGLARVALDGPIPTLDPIGKHMWMLNGSGARPFGSPMNHVLTIEEIASRATKTSTALIAPPAAPQIQQPLRAAMLPAPRPLTRMERPRMDMSPQDTSGLAPQVSGSAADFALAEFQTTMARFLETQERVMLAYLGAAPASAQPRQIMRQVAPVARPMIAVTQVAAPIPAPAAMVAAPVPAPVAATLAPVSAPVAAPVAASAPAPAAVTAKGLDKAGISALLVGIVEDRTGYPGDMLGMDQSIEADLGIDSIKRVEIIGALLKGLPSAQGAAAAPISEALNEQKTLGGIIEKLTKHLETAGPFDLTGVENAEPKTSARPPRFVMIADTAGPVPAANLPVGRYLIVSNGTARDRPLRRMIAAAGSEAIIASPAMAQTLAGPFAGMIHLGAAELTALSLKDDPALWDAAIEASDRSAYQLCRAHVETFKTGRIVLVSALGGHFGRDRAQAGLMIGGGGPGLAKSLREEWPDARTKAVDLDPSQPVKAQVAALFAELAAPEGRIEVGYPGGSRTVFRATETALPEAVRAVPQGAVIVATGGARGITAEILRPFAKPGITLVLIGRSALPAAESAEMVALTEVAQMRRHLMETAKAKGAAVTPAQMERAISGIQRDREIRANIADLTGAGAVVDYRTADMGDPAEVAAVMAKILARYRVLYGVIHGAGVIEDKRINDKTPESWNRVVLPKVLGALALARAVDAAPPAFFSVFASVAGRFGNSGQTDYAAANEVLNRLAAQLGAQWPQSRVVAVNWGPWAGTRHGAGMVSDAVRLKFEAQDVTLVDPEGGAEAFHDEMLRGPLSVTDVVLGAGPWERHERDRAGAETPTVAAISAPANGLPLLPDAHQEPGPRGGIKVSRVLSLQSDPWLGEHRIGGVPVLPLACATEMCAEAAAFIWSDWQVTGLSDLRALAGLRLEGDAPLAVDLIGMGSEHADATGFFARVELRGAGEKARAHYRASVQMLPKGAQVPVDEEALAAAWEMLRFAPAASPLSAQKIYREMLFHGPSFQLMKQLQGLDARGVAISVKDSHPGSFGAGGWFFDPGLLDTAAQLAWVWSMAIRGEPALPNAIGRAVRLGPGAADRMVLRLRPEAGAKQVLADVVVANADGAPILLIESLEATSDAGLNRFCGWAGEILPDVTDIAPAEAAE